MRETYGQEFWSRYANDSVYREQILFELSGCLRDVGFTDDERYAIERRAEAAWDARAQRLTTPVTT